MSCLPHNSKGCDRTYQVAIMTLLLSGVYLGCSIPESDRYPTPVPIYSPPPLPELPSPSPTPTSPPRSLENGTVIDSLIYEGKGHMTVENDTARDAVVKLRDDQTQTTIASIYVKAHHQAELPKVPDGVFHLLFTSGLDWDSELQKFTQPDRYRKFVNPARFMTKVNEQNGYQYEQPSHWTIYLQPSPAGKDPVDSISEKEFRNEQ
ncbi:hypothetical protein [Acaryochloris sp. IP29b_bin.148]|uniref:hypothetical protein n=1 Tax=Acaryochloris sp. IP29b_bin.148 TaxID=2969218 RepID=UPI002621C387|nr:hypothetical protein [Acaryochloris sp. IP29b_bin.148]